MQIDVGRHLQEGQGNVAKLSQEQLGGGMSSSSLGIEVVPSNWIGG